MAKRDKNRVPLRDWHLWTEVKRTVLPLRPEPPAPVEDEPLPLPGGAARATSVNMRQLTPTVPATPAAPRPALNKSFHEIEPRLRRRLGRGQIEIDGTIDLHGMRQSEARLALQRFLNARAARGDRTVLVITGKGIKKTGADAATLIEGGVLRSMLPVWLSEPGLSPLVSGWHAAAQAHGGDGAFYVRLRRGRG